jgi:YegS/Rv2252/BmrU family lipid kinase
MSKEKIIFIVNPKAGVRKNFTRSLIESTIDHNKFDFEIAQTQHEGHATEIAAKAVSKNVNLVIACGGDGTVNEVAKGLLGHSSSLGIIPLGSGNGLARHLGIPVNIPKALAIINNGTDHLIHGGKINDDIFLCAAGFGFDAYIAKLFQNQTKRGLFSYIRLILKEFKKYPTFSIEHPENKQLFKNLFLCSIANANQFGNDFKLVANKKVTDAYLQLVMVEKPNFFQFVKLSYHARFGNPEKLSFVHTYKFKTIKNFEIPSYLCHLDGEPSTLKQNNVIIKHIENIIKVRYLPVSQK